MRIRIACLVAVLGVMAEVPSFAHHSFAAFDRSRELQVTGTVREWQWTNPHTWLFVTVLKADGQTADFAFQGYNPAELPRMGITRNKFKLGDKVTVHYFPRKDDANGGQLVSVSFSADESSTAASTPSR